MSVSTTNSGSIVETGFGYFSVLTGLIRRPGMFFGALPEQAGLGPPLKFLLISALIMSAAGFSRPADQPWLRAGIEFVNALGMPFIMAAAALPATLILTRGRIGFTRLLTVFAYAAGAVLPILWLPAFFILAESGRWILVGFGLVHHLNLTRFKAFLLIIISMILTNMAVRIMAEILQLV